MLHALYGYECGVLLGKENPEFDSYANNNPLLPYGFYDEDQGLFSATILERIRGSLREYVENGVDTTYAVISLQGEFSEHDLSQIIKDQPLDDLMSYTFFKNKDEIVYSVCKIDGMITEGFLENLIAEHSILPKGQTIQQPQNDSLVSYGHFQNSFFAIRRHNPPAPVYIPYYSICVIASQPKDFSPDTVDTFIRENANSGRFVAGTWPQVMRELHGQRARLNGVGPERFKIEYSVPDLIPTTEKDLSIPPLCSVRDLSETVTAIANRAFEIVTDETSTGQYYVGYDDFSDLINKEDYLKYFDLIVDEVYSHDALLDLEITKDNELDMVCGLAWCKHYDPIPGDEYTEPGIDFGYEELQPVPSLAHLAEVGAKTINQFLEQGSLSATKLKDLGVTDKDINYFAGVQQEASREGRMPSLEQVIAAANQKAQSTGGSGIPNLER